MKSLLLLLIVWFSFLIFIPRRTQGVQFLLSCGSNSTSYADSRKWASDSTPNGNFTLSDSGIAAFNSISVEDTGYTGFGSLYRSARFFNTSASYNFIVDPGNYCLRLHFYPFQFGIYNSNDSAFDVNANDLKLATKLNISNEISWRAEKTNSYNTSIVKEYYINVDLKGLQIKFVPNPSSFAFINAIEVLTAPNNLFNSNITKVGSNGFTTITDRAIETMYRLNIGGPELKSTTDQFLYRNWYTDDNFMFSVNAAIVVHNDSSISYVTQNYSSIAPLWVYETARVMGNTEVVEKRFNVSWRFFVDPSFDYLIRLHFCELIYDKPNQRMFKIYINNKTAAENYDVYVQAGGINKAYFEDYFVILPQQTDTLWLQLGPGSLLGGPGTDALLNGLEIFKLSKNGNLAHVLDWTSLNIHSHDNLRNKLLIEEICIGIACVLILVSLCGGYSLYVRGKKKNKMATYAPPGWHPLALHEAMKNTSNACPDNHVVKNFISTPSINSRTGRRFTLAEIKTATRNFDESAVIGNGGFGKVYRGEIDGGSNIVAVKRADPLCGQGLKEFETEIEMLSKLRHRHLVSLIGYCEEQGEMILVYEFMANGTLRNHLYGSPPPASVLTYKQRVEVCVGAARGLHYLHTGSEVAIIHRDVKTTNILLDEEFVAKMSDFGLSRAGPTLDQTHVSTAVKGSFGYLDPEYFRRQQLTQKSDVYSFGVVLFEVLCGRPVIDPSLPKDQINLAEWAQRWQRQRSIETIVDSRIERDYSVESLKKFAEIAEKCLTDEGKNRPTMGEVLWQLEYALQLHDAYIRERESFRSNKELPFGDAPFSLSRIREDE
jgi:Protein tyrosine and serine/threonine kinase/Malectin-like domain